MKPRIGVTASLSVHEDRAVDALERVFVAAVLRAGGLPLVLPVADPADAAGVAACVDGLLLSGGGDVEPSRYGGAPSPELRGVEPARDDWELALARHAFEAGIPVLGTCRGAQVLNVARGGTLVAHLPDVTDRPHCRREQEREVVHDVVVQPDSVLRRVLGGDTVGVNSLHHQAVADVGQGLAAVAWSDDGVVEAVEGLGTARALGVQWHPELLGHIDAHAALFRWLVEEAGRCAPASTAGARELLGHHAPLAAAG